MRARVEPPIACGVSSFAALTDKLQLAVHEKRKAVKHCERILDESRDIVHKRGDLIKQLDEEARSRIQVSSEPPLQRSIRVARSKPGAMKWENKNTKLRL